MCLGMINCNRAVHGDIVAIEMLPKEQWTCPARLLKVTYLHGFLKKKNSLDFFEFWFETIMSTFDF